MVAIAVDVDHLHNTLLELGYRESFGVDCAPLLHHLLSDYNQLTKQHLDLLEAYEQLQHHKTVEVLPSKDGKRSFDLAFEGLELDGSFTTRSLERARQSVDELKSQVLALSEENKKLIEEKNSIKTELINSQKTTNELSNLIHSKNSLLENLQVELSGLKKKLSEKNFANQLSILVQNAIRILPLQYQALLTSKRNDISMESMCELLGEVLQKIRNETESQNKRLEEQRKRLEHALKENVISEESVAKLKAGITQYQGQILELNSRIHQYEFNSSMNSDLKSQLDSLERINRLINDKLGLLDRMRTGGQNGINEMTQITSQTVLESLSAELHTEVGFSTHLNQMVEKLNTRRNEQDAEIRKLHEKLRGSEEIIVQLEAEKTQIKRQLDQANYELSRKEGNMVTTQEIVKNLQIVLEEKQAKISEQKKHIDEIKVSLDHCQSSMENLRKNEEVNRRQVMSQDGEIRQIKSRYEFAMAENGKLVKKIAELESEQVQVKNSLKEKIEEMKRLEAEVKVSQSAKEKAQMDLKIITDRIRELEEGLNAKRREKDLLMTTYCKVIKDNERLLGELQKIQEEIMVKNGDGSIESALKGYQTKLQVQNHEIDRLRNNIQHSEGRISELESRLNEQVNSKRLLEQEVNDKAKEISSLKGIISSLERSKKDIAAQMNRFGNQANDLRHHVRRLEEEKKNLYERLRSASIDSPIIKELQANVNGLSLELEQMKTQLRLVEKERDSLHHQIQMEKLKASQLEEKALRERNNVRDHQPQTRGSSKSQQQQRQYSNQRNDYTLPSWSKYRSRDDLRNVTPSPSASPSEDENVFKDVNDGVEYRNNGTTERLRVQNKLLRDELEQIKNEVRRNLSPTKSSYTDLESSITGELSSEGITPLGEEVAMNGATNGKSSTEMKKKLEEENRILFRIIDKVKSELQKANEAVTPRPVAAV